MGTRADFYIKNEKGFEWLGSIAWDGYEVAEAKEPSICLNIKAATTEEEYRSAVMEYFLKEHGDDHTMPFMGWPWPWDNSGTTDYGYVFENGHVTWDDRNDWPDMSAIKKVDFGSRSGIMIITAPK